MNIDQINHVMTPPANLPALLAFARLHDWGFDAELVSDGVRVGCEVRHADGSWTREFTVLPDLRALRRWAGY